MGDNMTRCLLPVLWLLSACAPSASVTEESSIRVTRGDLVLEVDVVGTLTATRSAPVGPPSALDQDEFKIAEMATEGSYVKEGTRVLFFDSGELENELLGRTAERDSAAKEIERKLHELELSRREGEMRVTEAEAMTRKAALKADLPAKYTAAVEMKLAQIDQAAAEAELKMARQRLEHSLRLGRAELAYLRDRHARFAGAGGATAGAGRAAVGGSADRRGGRLPEQLAGREEEGWRRLLGGRALRGGHRHPGDAGHGARSTRWSRPGWRWGRPSACASRRCPSWSGWARWRAFGPTSTASRRATR